ncbi:hypothetical protein F2Q69_00030245 [Brassica cretica]|uniref:Uncharacterized protein n=1 Tax=Brassica cretica TaxID=69181 RepID=A0A8S9RR60_BRACR|nr:hypothetical protein F2Q69_00030245 [Brassica cretica]
MFSLANKNCRIEGTLSCTRTGDAVSSRGAFPLLSGDIAKALLVGSLQSLELKLLFGSLCVLLYLPGSDRRGYGGLVAATAALLFTRVQCPPRFSILVSGFTCVNSIFSKCFFELRDF